MDITEYSKGKGEWLSADMVNEGDTLTVMDEGAFESYEDKQYFVITVKYMNKELKLRLGVRNSKRISNVLGRDTKNWVGQKLSIAAIEDYPGVKAKGMILTGVKKVETQL